MFTYTSKVLRLMFQVIVDLMPVIGLTVMVGDSVSLVEVSSENHIIGEILLSILLATVFLIRGQQGMDNVMEGLIKV